MTQADTRTVSIDLFTDIICPWCLVGTAQFDRAVAALPEDVTVKVTHHPFLLDPGIPTQGQNTRERLAAKYGDDVAPMQARVETMAREAGVPLDLSVQPMSYPTIDAHTLIRCAPSEHQYGLAKAYAGAYFLEGANIADHAVLTEIASAHAIAPERAATLLSDDRERETTVAMAHSVARQGVNGVPFFIFEGKFALSGAQPPEVFGRAFRSALGQEPIPRRA